MILMNDEAARLNSLYVETYHRKFEFDNFEHKIRLQEMAYILTTIGIARLPKQEWYVKGPFSFHISTLGYEIKECKNPPCYLLSQLEMERISKLRKEFSDDMYDFDKIELLVSVVYAMREYCMTDTREIMEWILGKKPWYEKKDIREMIQKVMVNRELFRIR